MLATVAGALVFLAISAGLFGPLERAFPHAGVRRSAGAMALCGAMFVLNTALMRAIGDPVLGWLESLRGASVGPPSPARVALAFFLADGCSYAVHRALHRIPWLWRFHRIHHEAVELRWWDAWRQHPLDFVIQGLAVGIPGALLGASLSDLVSVVLLRKLWTSFLHADVRARFRPLEWLLATPAFHRVHHGADPADFDKNFAGTFPVWDVLFGTWRAAPTPAPATSASARASPG